MLRMKNKLPIFLDRNLNPNKICIICEGPEEYEYLEKLNSLGVWSNKYSIVLVPADGNGNVPARYQDKFQNGSYDIVLAFCDTDKKPYEQYEDIKRKINEFHGIENANEVNDIENVAAKVLIFGNPCTMQIILGHWIDVKLKSHSKRVNASLIKDCAGVENYKARADQRQQLFSKITKENYQEMHERVKKMPEDDTVIGSSNFGRFIDYFMNDDAGWINEINENLE